MESKATFKLSKTQGFILSVFLISVLMTAVMSLGMFLVEAKTYDALLGIVWKQFLIGCCIAVPAGFILVPLIQHYVDKITSGDLPAKIKKH